MIPFVTGSHKGTSEPFISKWDTSKSGVSSSTQIQLPLLSTGTYNFIVDWGDGTYDRITTYNQPEVTHTYSSSGTYTVTCNGILKQWAFDDGGDKDKIIDVLQWGDFNVDNAIGVFEGCSNLDISATDAPDLSTTTSLGTFFRKCTSLTAPDFSSWDTSNIRAMGSMFNNCPSLTTPNINSWDTSSLGIGTSNAMLDTFSNCTNFNSPLSGWDVSNVNSFYRTFRDCSSFNQSIDNWDVSGVDSSGQGFSQMFFGCTDFNQPLTNWDVSNCTKFSSMFYRAESFNQPLNNWDTGNATNMSNMFNDAKVFNQDLDNWDVSSVQSMSFMFQNALDFNGNITTWNTSSVTSMERMFRNANSFNKAITNWNVGNVENMKGMFARADTFNQSLSGWVTSSLTNMIQMFYNAINFNGDVSNFVTSGCTDFVNVFRNSRFNQPINNWDVSNVTRFQQMFRNTSFNQPLDLWDTSSAENFKSMFTNAPFDQDISSWDVTSLISADNMFGGTAGLSTSNYDLLLVGWESQLVNNNVTFHGGSSKYTFGSTAEQARIDLINDHSWSITDGGGEGVFDNNATALVGYSLRYLDSSYSGDIIRVRRSSDNVEQDFTPTEIRDGTLTTFCGASSGYIKTWYNQGSGGSTYDITQTNTSLQPQIVSSGSLLTDSNGLPRMYVNSDYLEASSTSTFNFLHDGATSTMFFVLQPGTTSNPNVRYVFIQNTTGQSDVGMYIAYDDRGSLSRNNGIGGAVTSGFGISIAGFEGNIITANNTHIINSIQDPNNATTADRELLYIDNSSVYKRNTYTGGVTTANATTPLKILGSSFESLVGYGQEVIIYDNDQSGSRTGIRDDINQCYDIY